MGLRGPRSSPKKFIDVHIRGRGGDQLYIPRAAHPKMILPPPETGQTGPYLAQNSVTVQNSKELFGLLEYFLGSRPFLQKSRQKGGKIGVL